MLFNSFQFLMFFPIVAIVYYVIPSKWRYLWLLAASYYFYMGWNPKYALLLLFTTVVTYVSGLVLDRITGSNIETSLKTRFRKITVAFSFICNLGVLFFFKYLDFAAGIICKILGLVNINLSYSSLNILLPVGISFFTFQSLSYTVDVYRGEIYTEKNFFRYALYVSFFPQLVAGPIERSKNLLKQLAKPAKFDFNKAKDGLLLMLWGYFLKLLIADRIAIVIDTIYDDPATYGGLYIVVATVLFAFQIYCDFAGYSTIAVGTAEIMGINLMENFNAPYLSCSVAEFWRKWHISLTSWFRDYVYIPLGGNKKGNLRKYCNCLIVFLLSGLWHGASFAFVLWGALNGIYQIIGTVLQPARDRLIKVFRLNSESIGFRLYKRIVTFVLVDFAWLFFRSGSMEVADSVLKSMLSVKNPWILFDGSLYSCGLDQKNFNFAIICILILLVVDYLRVKGNTIRELIGEQDWLFQVLFITLAICFILVFGIWGSAYDAKGFIYFQF